MTCLIDRVLDGTGMKSHTALLANFIKPGALIMHLAYQTKIENLGLVQGTDLGSLLCGVVALV